MVLRAHVAIFLLALAACGRDPGAKATRPECERACAHSVRLHKGGADPLENKCPALCVENEWTVGDLRCLSDATTGEALQRCPVVAKAVDDRKREALLEEHKAKIERLLADLKSAGNEDERAAIQKQLEEAQAARNKLLGVAGTRTNVIHCTCEPGDTDCSML